MRPIHFIVCALTLAGCAHVAPKELVTARYDYERASLGAAAEYTPADLNEARKVLEQANRELEQNGDTDRARRLAYIASRKVDVANINARIEQDRRRVAALSGEAERLRDQQYAAKQRELFATREQLAAQQHASELATQQLETERQARQTVEGRLQRAMRDLATIAAVKEERRGVVITISGSVLFAPGRSMLLATAQTRLDQVAQALRVEADGARITVEGHTDSIGSAEYNEQLSMLRALAVRDYLVRAGVRADRIDARGYGESRPLTDNSTPESRANNRRVEIVVHQEDVPVG